MATRESTSHVLLFLHLLIALFCLGNVLTIHDRARVPFEVVSEKGITLVGHVDDSLRANGIQAGDRLKSWRNTRIAMAEHVELLGDLTPIGERVSLTVERNGEVLHRTVELVPFYTSYRFAVVTAIAGLTILIFGLFVYLKRPRDPAALLLHWALVSLGTVTMMTQGSVEADSILSYSRRVLLFVSYNGTVGFFFLFALQFPRRLMPGSRAGASAFLSTFFLLAAALSWFHITAMRTGDPEAFAVFQKLYDVFHLIFLVVPALGIVLIYIGSRHEHVPERRRALRWILYGLLVGATPFLLLVVLPQLWRQRLFVPEELATFFTLAIPLSFTIAFLRYHVFSIAVQQRQRLTTLLLRASLAALQLLFVAIVLSIFWEHIIFGPYVLEILILGVGVVVLSPVRSRLTGLIEEAIYPARFNPARLIQDASSRFSGLLYPAAVGPALIVELHTIIPRWTFTWYRWNGHMFTPRSTTDPAFLPPLRIPKDVMRTIREDGCASARQVVRNIQHSPKETERWLEEAGFSCIIPLPSDDGGLLGAVCALKERSGDPLDSGEFEVVRTLCQQASSVLEHLRTQENMILEQRKRKELEELDRLKTHFVSSVSHDLRTPLTSLGMFLDLLEKPRLKVRERNEYIAFIRQESERLRRLVDNVLDFAKAERKSLEYLSVRCDLSAVLRQAADAMAGQFKAVDAAYSVRIPRALPVITGDPEALERAFVNILSNAFKYTPAKKRVSFIVRKGGGSVRIIIRDNGFGIPRNQIRNVFDPFFRVRDKRTSSTGGVGLGLSLVKRTIEHHGGDISIRSDSDKGTTVTVTLPIHTSPREDER